MASTEPPVRVTGSRSAPPVAPEASPDDLETGYAGTPRWAVWAAVVVGTGFLLGAVVNAAVTLVAPGAYVDLGDWLGAPGPLDRAWDATVGMHPRVWVPAIGVAYELVVAILCLSRGRRRRALGLAGGAAFHAGLAALGLWLWALPVAAVLAWAAVVAWRAPTDTPS